MIIVDNSGNRRVLRVKDKKLKHFKVFIDLKYLIGANFGTHFAVKDPKIGDLEQITDVKLLTKAFLEDASDLVGDCGIIAQNEEDNEEEKSVKRDNRDIIDNNTAQKMTHAEIEELKASGISGGLLISKLIENSESFSKRTKFS